MRPSPLIDGVRAAVLLRSRSFMKSGAVTENDSPSDRRHTRTSPLEMNPSDARKAMKLPSADRSGLSEWVTSAGSMIVELWSPGSSNRPSPATSRSCRTISRGRGGCPVLEMGEGDEPAVVADGGLEGVVEEVRLVGADAGQQRLAVTAGRQVAVGGAVELDVDGGDVHVEVAVDVGGAGVDGGGEEVVVDVEGDPRDPASVAGDGERRHIVVFVPKERCASRVLLIGDPPNVPARAVDHVDVGAEAVVLVDEGLLGDHCCVTTVGGDVDGGDFAGRLARDPQLSPMSSAHAESNWIARFASRAAAGDASRAIIHASWPPKSVTAAAATRRCLRRRSRRARCSHPMCRNATSRPSSR